jgi:hypothetical protein
VRCLRLLPFLSLAVALALAASAGCSSLKSADPSLTDPDGGDGAAVDGAFPPEGDGGVGDSAADAEGGPAPAVCTDTTCPVEQILKDLYGPVSIAVNTSHLYTIEVGSVPNNNDYGMLSRIAKTLACKTRSCFTILDDRVLNGQLQGQNIYEAHVALGLNDVCYTQSFNTNAQHSVRCFALTTLVRRPLDDGAGALIDLWVGATEARWVLQSTTATSADGFIMGRPLTGGTTTALASGRMNPIGVASDGTKTYWSEIGPASPQGTINTLADGGGVAIATGRANPTSIRLYGQYLYWIEAQKKVVMRGRTDGTGTPEQIAITDDNPIELSVDASGVYWISSGLGGSGLTGSLAHAPLTPGGAITVMIKDINLVYSLAVDTTHVYVAAVGQMIADGQIVRIKKSR